MGSIEMKSKYAKTTDRTYGSDLEVENRGGATGLMDTVGMEIRGGVFGKCDDGNIE